LIWSWPFQSPFKRKLEEWTVAIGNWFFQLKQTLRLCEDLFLDEELIKGKIIGGMVFSTKFGT
jgi:hypothetical protein